MGVSDQIDNINEKLNWHWRNSMRTVRFFAFDARASIVLILIFFRMTDIYAWLLVFATFAFFRFLERKGLTFPAALRNFRMWLVGKERPGLMGVYRRRFRDFG
jgi:hypothetical protein